MNYTELEQKLKFYQQHRHLIPDAAIQNYEAAFRIEYTHHSTAIEGNTLSLIETKLLLEDGISPGGKELREIYEAVNHNKAFTFISRCVAEGKPLDKNIVKDIHAILMENILAGGIYRNVDVYISGARHTPPSPDEAYRQLEVFYDSLLKKQATLFPIEFAAWTHAEFVKIHPFIDGNGRTSRLLMNYQLTAAGYLPVSIPQQRRIEYFETLEAYACEGDLSPFAELVGGLEDARLDQYIRAITQVIDAEQKGKDSSITERLQAATAEVERRDQQRDGAAAPRDPEL